MSAGAPAVEPLDQKTRDEWRRMSAHAAAANAGPWPCRVSQELEAAARSEPQSPVAPAYRLWIATTWRGEARYAEALRAFDAAIASAQSSRRFLPRVDPICCSFGRSSRRRRPPRAVHDIQPARLAVRTRARTQAGTHSAPRGHTRRSRPGVGLFGGRWRIVVIGCGVTGLVASVLVWWHGEVGALPKLDVAGSNPIGEASIVRVLSVNAW
jgi:hypothetical protein